MDDRTLLEDAARAAGIAVEFSIFSDGSFLCFKAGGDCFADDWNPLTDDGDALRLAARLGIKIVPYPIFAYEKHSVIASRRRWAPPDDDENTYIGPEIIELYGADPLAATRRAITRAAAQIGKQMREARCS